MAITDTSSSFAQFQVSIPVDWDTGTLPYILLAFESATDTTSGHTVKPEVAVSCPTATNGTSTDDVTLSAYQTVATVKIGGSAVAHGFVHCQCSIRIYADERLRGGRIHGSQCWEGGG